MVAKLKIKTSENYIYNTFVGKERNCFIPEEPLGQYEATGKIRLWNIEKAPEAVIKKLQKDGIEFFIGT